MSSRCSVGRASWRPIRVGQCSLAVSLGTLGVVVVRGWASRPRKHCALTQRHFRVTGRVQLIWDNTGWDCVDVHPQAGGFS